MWGRCQPLRRLALLGQGKPLRLLGSWQPTREVVVPVTLSHLEKTKHTLCILDLGDNMFVI